MKNGKPLPYGVTKKNGSLSIFCQVGRLTVFSVSKVFSLGGGFWHLDKLWASSFRASRSAADGPAYAVAARGARAGSRAARPRGAGVPPVRPVRWEIVV